MSVIDQLVTANGARPAGPTQPKKKSLLQLEITPKKVPPKDLMQFSRQLSVFVRAGIPILDALEAIREDASNKLLKEIISSVLSQLRAGRTFAEAAADHASALPSYYLGILRSAELSGQLDVALIQLSEYIERDLEARRKITSALAYPAVIFMTAIGVVVVLVAFVLPKFEQFFAGLNAELPLPTRLLLGATGAARANVLWILLGSTLVLAVLLAALRTAAGRSARDRLLLATPVVGDLVRHVVLERFCRILSAMMTAGVPLLDALAVTTDATSNAVYKRGLAEARQATIQGEGLAGPLIATGLFPSAARQMFRVGENTGTLDQQLAMSAQYFARELDYKIKRFTTLFEPAVLLVVGVMVGFVAVALVSAMYGIFDATRSV